MATKHTPDTVRVPAIKQRLKAIRTQLGNIDYYVSDKRDLSAAHSAAEDLQHLAFDLKHYIAEGD